MSLCVCVRASTGCKCVTSALWLWVNLGVFVQLGLGLEGEKVTLGDFGGYVHLCARGFGPRRVWFCLSEFLLALSTEEKS